MEDKDRVFEAVQLISELQYKECPVCANALEEVSEGYVQHLYPRAPWGSGTKDSPAEGGANYTNRSDRWSD
jgi:hypothetical protein